MQIVLATTAAERGGVWKHMMDLAGGLSDFGDDVVIGVPHGARDLEDDARSAGLVCHPLRVATAVAADVWHLHLPKPFDRRTLPLMLTARARGNRTFVTEHLPRHPSSDASLHWETHGPPGRRKPGAAVAKTAVKIIQSHLAHHTITVSRSSRDFLLKRFKMRPAHCAAIVNGVAYADASPMPAFSDGLKVLAVGAVGTRKGHDLIIEAAQRSRRRWRVDVLGVSGELAQFRQRAAATGGRVAFRGWADDVSRHVDAHHVLCMPSRYEPFGYAAVEAMMRGRPVVASAVDGLVEVVDDNVTGKLIAVGDADALARALDDLADSPETVARWGAAAHERARDLFDLRIMTERIRNVYEGVPFS